MSQLDTVAKLWSLLAPEYRTRALRILALMLIAVVLETTGVSLVVPVLALLTLPDLGARYPVVAPLLHTLGDPEPQQLILGAMASLVGFFALKAAFVGFLAWRQMAFIYDLQGDFATRLFAAYLRQPYTFHLQRNSAQLIRNLTSRVSDITTALLGSISLLTEVQVLIALALLLVFVEPVGAVLVAISLGLAGWEFHRLTRTRVLRWGSARAQHDTTRLQYLMQGLGGVKEIKLLGKETEFASRFQSVNNEFCRFERYQTTLHQFPRLLTELLAVAGLAALIAVMIAKDRPLAGILPTIGVFAAAAFRLMPSINRVIGSLQDIRFLQPAVMTMHAEFEGLSAAASPLANTRVPFRDAISMAGVAYRYPTGETEALHDITLSIAHGSTVGFIGASGAGKSTLIDLLLGLLPPDRGAITVDGRDIRDSLRAWQDQIGYVPQSIFLSDDTLRHNVAFGVPECEIDDAAVRRAIKAAQLEGFVAAHSLGVNLPVGERGVRLSGGQRQRIGIARALYHDPQVLVLDEATSSLDIQTEAGVMEAVAALHGQKTIIIVAHRTSTVAVCDRLFRIDRGRLVEQGTTPAVLAGPLGVAAERPAS